ncbi:DNA polymerase III subunit chi [Aliidiomarina taiwanensis]|uniref:DNA polymerase III subunit chi n=1 Tax=Aliidiomarina taiwanensis TaxID=946228 RepID=A0A432X015_9GAMM|nr:DNA polymerase III subunit chi [Aliidiomarina taiwanensis]RUO39318.1 DNA polymerase III subunit chi [Aliidiomarina taiwanensis]
MAVARFYTLDEVTDKGADSFVCSLVYELTQQRQRVLLLCANQEQAEQYDELLWAMPTDAFIPHNLVGEGPEKGTPVLIAWLPLTAPLGHYPTVVNLTQAAIPAEVKFRTLIELVPVAAEQRQRAREHYKLYRQQGLQMQNLVARINVEGHHG